MGHPVFANFVCFCLGLSIEIFPCLRFQLSVKERPKGFGYGQKGVPINLEANWFPLELPKQRLAAYQYDVVIRDRDFPDWEERETMRQVTDRSVFHLNQR